MLNTIKQRTFFMSFILFISDSVLSRVASKFSRVFQEKNTHTQN